ncbi:hypothetical protein [Caballeronia cordobensis]|uniref:Uncharacterized protein n=1 Tax=Caballeronia cordobensis TaxID=1353886 RepID=A0A158IQ92_CABCO|nr:hypothetical protein [Caballeronia cordobensis]AET92017.1 conserved hypothetical protein [Burkholderia sp. YI23]AQH00512.1 hypothetical protein A9R05_16110 [Burkholderia sp. KK1]BAO88020.1 putative uncharacterized protein [Burkholderia sp. RPE67]SAL58359.1 hypothetical protein AWB70_05178 [Caballeronia cordobensis]
MKRMLIVEDLKAGPDDAIEASLTPAQMKRIVGGRAVLATVDGRGYATIDDWDANLAIFEGRIKGSERDN